MAESAERQGAHTMRFTTDKSGFFYHVTLDGVEIPNVTEIHIRGRQAHVSVELTMEHVEVETVLGVGPGKVTTTETTTTYEGGRSDWR